MKIRNKIYDGMSGAVLSKVTNQLWYNTWDNHGAVHDVITIQILNNVFMGLGDIYDN